MNFRERLRKEMSYIGISSKKLAEISGVSLAAICTYRSKKCVIPPADVAVAIAQALNTTVEYLVCGDTDKDEEYVKIGRRIITTYRAAIEERWR